jgi:hypothetical protein
LVLGRGSTDFGELRRVELAEVRSDLADGVE